MASVFTTFSFKPQTFSKSLSNLSKAWAEFKSAKMAVVSSANWSNLVSESLILIPLIFTSFRTAIANISKQMTKTDGESGSH